MATNYNRRIDGIVNQLQDLFCDMFEEEPVEGEKKEVTTARFIGNLEDVVSRVEDELAKSFHRQINLEKE